MAMILPRFMIKGDFSPFEDLFFEQGGVETVIPKGVTLDDANAALPRTTYYIKKGVAKLSIINETGAEHILFFMGQGSVYPINNLDDCFSMEVYVSMTALTDLEVISIFGENVEKMIAENGEFALAVTEHYMRYVNTLLTKILFNSYNDSTRCVPSFLYLYAASSPENMVDLTQEQIGQILSLSRPQVVRVLNKLRTLEIVATRRGKLKVLDMERLRELCVSVVDDEYCTSLLAKKQ